MKKTKLLYWIFTLLFGGFMLFSAVPDILLSPETVTFMQHLGYPDYFTVFIGVAKALGVIAILIPGFNRIKEWAYAGLFFDLIGAVYSLVAIEGFAPPMAFMLIPFVLGILSYVYYHKKISLKNI
ncbi:MAG: hypothetical protein RIR31_801 [Bacteroidota bacterium]|jgi:hypothetical protein